MAKQGSLYLFTGPELGNRSEATEELRNSVKKQFGNIDEYLFYLLETPFNEIMTILQSGTLFSNGVFIVCKNAELLKKKEDLSMLSSWNENAELSTILVLISDDISVDTKLEKLISPSNRKKFWEMFENQKLPWIYDFFRKNGYKIQESAAQLILDMVENNTQSMKNECSRFFSCFPKGTEITEENVESILFNNREETVFSLFASLTNNNDSSQERLQKGLTILQKIRLSKENSSVMIIAGLTSCFRKLVNFHSQGESAIFGKLLQKQYSNAAKIWTLEESTSVLASLASTDMEIRNGANQIEDLLLQRLFYQIVIKKGSPLIQANYLV